MIPQSMPVGERNVLRSNDSSSLWNCTLSPGWTQEEVNILRLALMKFGIGNWVKIVDSQCLVGKTIAQMNLQTQRMLGQQSTAEFANLHIDPLEIGKINSLKQGPEIKRKNNFIVNTGGKITKEEKNKRLKENAKKYGLTKEQIDGIVLPTSKTVKTTIIEVETELNLLRDELVVVQEKIANFKKLHGSLNDLNKKPSKTLKTSSSVESLVSMSSLSSLSSMKSPPSVESGSMGIDSEQLPLKEVDCSDYAKNKNNYKSSSDSEISIC